MIGEERKAEFNTSWLEGLCDETVLRMLEFVEDGVYVVDQARTIRYWSPSAQRIAGYEADEMVGTHCDENRLRHVNAAGERLCDFGCPMVQSMESGKLVEVETYLHHKKGHRIPIRVKAVPLTDEAGHVVAAMQLFTDESQKQATLQQLRELREIAMLDPLTGLMNRRAAEAALATKLEEHHRYNWPMGMLFLDLDRFKAINDVYGHEAGDRFLVSASKTLRKNLRPFDIAARWGGEEFVAAVVNVDLPQLLIVAERIRSLVARSTIRLDGVDVGSTVSIGGTLLEPDDTLSTLINRADQLMYSAKEAGRNRIAMGSSKGTVLPSPCPGK